NATPGVMSSTSPAATIIHTFTASSSMSSLICRSRFRIEPGRHSLHDACHSDESLMFPQCDKPGLTQQIRGWDPAKSVGHSSVTRAELSQSSRAQSVVVSRTQSVEECIDEAFGGERREVVGAFAQSDELDRHPELTLDGHDDAALGGAVELREHDSGDVDRLGEDLRLLHAVLPGGGVEDEEDLVDLVAHSQRAGGHALDLAEFVHE